MTTPYRCPQCLGALHELPGCLSCADCKKEYPVLEDVPVFSRSRDAYYGEVSREVAREIIVRSTAVGWRRALLEYADRAHDVFFRNYLASDSRLGFKFLLNGLGRGAVLDCGCGMGAISAGLARHFDRVYATDLTLERAQFTRLRCQQDGLHNVVVFCSGDTPHLPLANASVDVIVLNGVLEWIPEFRPGEPRSAQLEFLEELERILTPTGTLFVGIENRVGVNYLLGAPEDHSHLRFMSLLPRRLADVYSHWRRQTPYRNYTYTRSGYRRLFRAAGFACTEFFCLAPSYRNPERVIQLSDATMIDASLNRQSALKRLRNSMVRPVLPYIAQAFGILVTRQRVVPYFRALAGHVSEHFLENENLRVSRYQVTDTGFVHLHASSRKANYVVKLPLSPRAESRMNRAIANLLGIPFADTNLPETLLIPMPIAWGEYLGQNFVVEPLKPGRSLDKVLATAGVEALFPRLLDYLVLLCSYTRKPAGTWNEVLGQTARHYSQALLKQWRERGLAKVELEPMVDTVIDSIDRLSLREPAFRCAAHGDFWYGNILADLREQRVTAVIDWDRCEWEGLPFLDLFSLLVMHEYSLRGRDWGASLAALGKALEGDSVERRRVQDYARRIGVDMRMAPAFLMVYWLRQCSLLLVDHPFHLAADLHEAIERPFTHFRTLAALAVESGRSAL